MHEKVFALCVCVYCFSQLFFVFDFEFMKYAVHASPIYSVRFPLPASPSLNRVGACFPHNKHFLGGGEVTEDLARWMLNKSIN